MKMPARKSAREFIRETRDTLRWSHLAGVSVMSCIAVAFLLAVMFSAFRGWRLAVTIVVFTAIDAAVSWWVIGFDFVQEWLRREWRG